ncbi:hypothetical protein CONLIGDRAFT_685917 [Coniochaeta ligniaria NRRL 30616]|uniref:Uncharacterized protein n=1 Tax=Coniochaeta ligniaria NRRL 30616 TaxID=1408157 RepID=A0A1J7IAG5_9PEZI|nr:hypothetical protein CONLIGDRAFT_685917 [Coniochaeta ligniaria NRRL 30616]
MASVLSLQSLVIITKQRISDVRSCIGTPGQKIAFASFHPGQAHPNCAASPDDCEPDDGVFANGERKLFGKLALVLVEGGRHVFVYTVNEVAQQVADCGATVTNPFGRRRASHSNGQHGPMTHPSLPLHRVVGLRFRHSEHGRLGAEKLFAPAVLLLVQRREPTKSMDKYAILTKALKRVLRAMSAAISEDMSAGKIIGSDAASSNPVL